MRDSVSGNGVWSSGHGGRTYLGPYSRTEASGEDRHRMRWLRRGKLSDPSGGRRTFAQAAGRPSHDALLRELARPALRAPTSRQPLRSRSSFLETTLLRSGSGAERFFSAGRAERRAVFGQGTREVVSQAFDFPAADCGSAEWERIRRRNCQGRWPADAPLVGARANKS